MMPFGDKDYSNGWGGGAGVDFNLGQTSDVRRRGRGGFRFKLCNNKRQSIGLLWSL